VNNKKSLRYKLEFPCGAFYPINKNADNMQNGANKLTIFESWQNRIPCPKFSDGKMPFCIGCRNRARKAVRVFIDDTEKLGYIIQCKAKITEPIKDK